jgi:hypothetical protein
MNKLIYTHIQKLHALVLEVTDEAEEEYYRKCLVGHMRLVYRRQMINFTIKNMNFTKFIVELKIYII